jgi:hypothetical protein
MASRIRSELAAISRPDVTVREVPPVRHITSNPLTDDDAQAVHNRLPAAGMARHPAPP